MPYDLELPGLGDIDPVRVERLLRQLLASPECAALLARVAEDAGLSPPVARQHLQELVLLAGPQLREALQSCLVAALLVRGRTH